MTLTWYGHACFMVETDHGRAIFDPYEPGSVPGLHLPELAAEGVFCSHGHHDHCYAAGVKQTRMLPDYKIETVPCFHDEVQGAKRGENLIHVLIAGGKRIVHMGDLGHTLSREQAAAIGTPDVLMIPVGGFYTVDAETAKSICEVLNPKVIIPMHYRGEGFGYDNIATIEDFTKLFDHVTYHDSNVLDLTEELSGVIVMKCPVGN